MKFMHTIHVVAALVAMLFAKLGDPPRTPSEYDCPKCGWQPRDEGPMNNRDTFEPLVAWSRWNTHECDDPKPVPDPISTPMRRIVVHCTVGCPPCERMKRETIPVLRAAGWRVDVVENHPAIRLFPTTICFSGDKKLGQFIGFRNAATVAAMANGE